MVSYPGIVIGLSTFYPLSFNHDHIHSFQFPTSFPFAYIEINEHRAVVGNELRFLKEFCWVLVRLLFCVTLFTLFRTSQDQHWIRKYCTIYKRNRLSHRVCGVGVFDKGVRAAQRTTSSISCRLPFLHFVTFLTHFGKSQDQHWVPKLCTIYKVNRLSP